MNTMSLQAISGTACAETKKNAPAAVYAVAGAGDAVGAGGRRLRRF